MKDAEVKNQAHPKTTPGMNIDTTNTEEVQGLTQRNDKKRRKVDILPNKDVNDSCTIKVRPTDLVLSP